MFKGIKILLPFLTPPLTPDMVGDALLHSIENSVLAPKGHSTVENALKQKETSIYDIVKQHKCLWMPSSYILPSLLGVVTPPWIIDTVKLYLGANSAVTNTFVGRAKAD
jgi:hypothetical protein